MNLHQKLIAVRKQALPLKKKNQGHGFKYVSSSQVITNLRSALDEHGVLLIPEIESAEVADHATSAGKSWKFTTVIMKFTWVNAADPQETISCRWYAQGLDDGEKGVGKALTYGEKYFLLKFFNIPTDKDDPDGGQGSGNSRQERPGNPAGGNGQQRRPPNNGAGTTGQSPPIKSDADPLGIHGPQGAPALADDPRTAAAREKVAAWMLEDCDGDDARVNSRLTDLVGRAVSGGVPSLTKDELKIVWKAVAAGRQAA